MAPPQYEHLLSVCVCVNCVLPRPPLPPLSVLVSPLVHTSHPAFLGHPSCVSVSPYCPFMINQISPSTTQNYCIGETGGVWVPTHCNRSVILSIHFQISCETVGQPHTPSPPPPSLENCNILEIIYFSFVEHTATRNIPASQDTTYQ